MKTPLVFGLLLSIVTGCGPKSGVGFHLPDGNSDRGKQAFLELKCTGCHSVQDVTFGTNQAGGHLNLQLGAESLAVHTYGQLVTAIINPSHIISPRFKKQITMEGTLSPMPDFNKVMTVEQMIDLVAFLQPHYKLPPPNPVLAN